LAAGGDGTINEVLQGVVFSNVPLGILPFGTANVLAMETALGTSPKAFAQQLPDCVARRISVGRAHFSNGPDCIRYFLLMAGVGLDAHIVYEVSMPLKARLGKLAYWIAGFKMLGRRLEEFEVEAEGRTLSCSFALVSKVRNYGGDFEIARNTSLFDDRFEVVLFEGSNPLRYMKYLAGVAAGRLSGMSGVTILRSKSVKFAPAADRRVFLQVDGEFAGHLPAAAEVVPDALTLLIPRSYYRKLGLRETGGDSQNWK
jgi:diacylglycerol kinase family enzyme